MSSRQEQKEARRRERLERERKEKAAAARRKRLQVAGGVLLGVAAIAGVVVAIAVGFGGDNGGGSSGDAADIDPAVAARIPEQQTTDLQQAAEAAGCELTNAEFEGAGHDEKDFKAADYQTNPPTSGNHDPVPYDDGIYAAGTTPELGKLVHTLEHGRINIQYKKGTPAETVEELEALAVTPEMNEGYHLLVYENTTGMEPAVAATAWTQSLTCPEMNDKVFDAIRTFRSRYIDKGPETVP